MIRLNRPNLPSQLGTLVHREAQVACRPVFRVTVGGVDPKHQDKAIPFQMHARASFADRTRRQCAIATSIWINLAVGLQAGEPLPAVGTDGFEISQRTVPAIEGYIARLKATRFGGLEQGAEVLVLGQLVDGFVKQPIVLQLYL